MSTNEPSRRSGAVDRPGVAGATYLRHPMKITRQLRLDALAADGTASIHLTISWEGNRLMSL